MDPSKTLPRGLTSFPPGPELIYSESGIPDAMTAMATIATDMNDGDDGDLEDRFDSQESTFGSFWIGGTEFLLAAEHISEVVRYPAHPVALPLSPDYVLGVFDLRGDIIPIVCVARLLRLEPPDLDDARIAIIDCGDERIGAVFARTGEVLRVHPDRLKELHHGPEEVNPVVSAVLSLDGGKRLLQVMSAALIAAVDEIPRGSGSARYVLEEETPKTRLVAVSVGELRLALPGEAVIEIQACDQVQESIGYFEHSLGLVGIRGELVPVLALDSALGTKNRSAQQHLVFVYAADLVCALLVDDVLNVFAVRDEAIREVPMLARLEMGSVCHQVVTEAPTGHLMMLDIAGLFERVGLNEATMGSEPVLSRLRPVEELDTFDEDEDDFDEGQSYLGFAVGRQRFALPLGSIREIQDFPMEVLRPLGDDTQMTGMMNLRGEIVSLVDLRSRYGIEALVPPEQCKVVIVEGASVGFLVDALTGIVHTDERSRLELPPQAEDRRAAFHSHMECVVQVDGNAMIALDPARLLAG